MTETTANPAAEPLPKAYDPSAIEEKWAAYWVEQRIFEVPAEGDAAAFTMLLPPPNVTGRLHMGHMLNQTEMDILTRWHRMRGERALWVPGTDHAGIATQMMVERQLAAEGKTDREAMGREAFVDRVWEWKRQYGGAITDQMRRLGASVDWSREYFTMDPKLSLAVSEAFVRLHEQGLIYRGAYIVNWDPAIGTAVSDLEVESEERTGVLYSVRYPLADGSGEIVIATTRPETMLGDTAVAVNPADERYMSLVGRQVTLPLTGRTIPIVADEWANPEFGTGAVKVTPAHDPNDFAIGQRCGLPNISMLDKRARVDLPAEATGDNDEGRAARERYQGLDRFAARKLVLEDLRERGLLVAEKEHPMTVPVSQRSGSVIEPRLSDQWFLRIQPLADKAVAAVREGHIRFTPEMYAKTYFEWMGNIHDWCVSRQLWWGHRIPAWFCGNGHVTVARETPAVCATCGSADLRQETDVLDTWFSSALLPFTVFGWPSADAQPTAEMKAFYPTSLLVTGFDILFFWVARMVMLGTHFMLDVPMPDGSPRALADAVPFREVYIHALVRDADRQKMSKTKGNVIDPIDIISRFGTDAVRFTLASMASPGTDIAFSEARTEGNRAFANKIWNAARFLFMNLERARTLGLTIDLSEKQDALAARAGSSTFALMRAKKAMPELRPDAEVEARWILSRLSNVSHQVGAALEEYRFDEASRLVYEYFWNEFCGWYLESLKARADFEDEAARDVVASALKTALEVFEASLRLLSPFMPFLTEELWHALFQVAPAKSVALTWFPVHVGRMGVLVPEMEAVQEVVTLVRQIRKQVGVPESASVPIRLASLDQLEGFVRAEERLIGKLARVGSFEYVDKVPSGFGTSSSARFDVEVLYERSVSPAEKISERTRLLKEIARGEKYLETSHKQLSNESYLSKAPQKVIDGLLRQQAEAQTQYQKNKAALEALGSE